MGFVLKIYLVGLIAFLPSSDGAEMTVLLLDARDGYALSDGTWMEEHEPLLLARAARCTGDCQPDLQAIADLLYPGDSEANRRRLETTLGGGGAWRLDGSELGVEMALVENLGARQELVLLGDTPRERFDWVAEIGRIEPSAGTIDPDVLAERPEKGLIVARMTVASGAIRTQRLVALDDHVVQLAFRTLRLDGAPIEYSQVLADRVVAEIPVAGCKVTLTERRFDGGPGRTMILAPERCGTGEVVEAALINLPSDSFRPHPQGHPREEVGKHFEMYYELAYLRPPNRLRPVPVPTEMSAAMEEITHAKDREWPDEPELLRAIGLPGRGAASRPICALSQFSPVATSDPLEATRAK